MDSAGAVRAAPCQQQRPADATATYDFPVALAASRPPSAQTYEPLGERAVLRDYPGLGMAWRVPALPPPPPLRHGTNYAKRVSFAGKIKAAKH